jgi:hypothetical protein
MAAGIAELELPILTIPDLFMAQKLVIPSAIPSALPCLEWRTPPLGPTHVPSTTPSVPEIPGRCVGAKSVTDPEPPAPKPSAGQPASYSSALQVLPKRVRTPELDTSESSVSSDDSDELPFPRTFPTFSRSRHVNPNIVESRVSILAEVANGTRCLTFSWTSLSQSVSSITSFLSHPLTSCAVQINLLHVLFSTSPAASMGRIVNMDMTICSKRSTLQRSV